MIKTYCGILEMPERDLNNIDYILKNNSKGIFNLTPLLHMNENKMCGITITHNKEDIFCEVGELYRYHGIWFINGVSIDETIWDLSGEFIAVIFDDELEEII